MINVNKAGADWIELRQFIRTEISRLRDELEQPGSTDFQRGQIASLRKLIAEVQPEKLELGDEDTYTQDPD